MTYKSLAKKADAAAVRRLLPEDHFFKTIADLHELIARRAYNLFAASGFSHGHDLEDWLRAESLILTVPPLEISELPAAIMVRAAMPGYSAEDINIYVEPLRLFISGQHQAESADKSPNTKQNINCSDQRADRVLRRIDLPAEIDPDEVKAIFSSGMLEIELPKVKAGQKFATVAGAAA